MELIPAPKIRQNDRRKERVMSENPKKRQASKQPKAGTREDGSGEDFIRKVRRKTRRRYTAEEKSLLAIYCG